MLHYQRHVVQAKGKPDVSILSHFNDVWLIQALHSRLLRGQCSAALCSCRWTNVVLSCQIKRKSLLKVCSPQLSIWSVSTLRIRMERAFPWLRQLSPVCISLHSNKTNVFYWCLNLPCSIASSVKESGRCLVSRKMQGGLPCDKYRAPNLKMLAKMQSLSLKHWQNAIPHPIKMLCFWFSFTKAAKSFWVFFAFSRSGRKMCKDLLSGARWQRWLLLRDWTWLGSACPVQGSKGNHLSYQELRMNHCKRKDSSVFKLRYLPVQNTSTALDTKSRQGVTCNSEGSLWCKVPFSGTPLG